MVKFKISLKIVSLKFQKSKSNTFVRTTEKKVQEKFENENENNS